MPNQTLQPFSPPTVLSNFLPHGLTSGVVVVWLLYLVFFFWAVYTLVAIYHWLKYSHASWVAFPAIAVHLVISICLMGYALSGSLPFV